MSDTSDDREVVWVRVALDALTAARLEELANVCHAPTDTVAGSLLRDILQDDSEAHQGTADRHVSIN